MKTSAYELARAWVFPEVVKALRSQNPTADDRNVLATAETIAQQVAPILVNQTNNEEWYKSRVIWGSLVAIGGGLLQLFGFAVDAQDQTALANLIPEAITLAGSAVALYGRIAAKKPL